jgi:hypothetical protein
MVCRFCKQDVDQPCHNAQEMKQRAMWHVPHCEKAMRSNQGKRTGTEEHQVQGGGRH